MDDPQAQKNKSFPHSIRPFMLSSSLPKKLPFLIGPPILIIFIALLVWIIFSGQSLEDKSAWKAEIQSIHKTQPADKAIDGILSSDNGVSLNQGEKLVVDLSKPETISQIELWQDIDKPGTVTNDVVIKAGNEPDLSDGEIIFEGSVTGGAGGNTISFPPTDAQYIQIIGGSNDSGESTINEITISNPENTAPTTTPVPTTALPNPTTQPTPTSPTAPTATIIPTSPPQPTSIQPTPTPISMGVLVTTNSSWPANQTMLDKLVNGTSTTSDYAQVDAGKYMQIHLPQPYTINKIQIYPRALSNQIIKEMKVEVSTSSSFANSTTLFYADVLSTVDGIIISPNPAVTAQYIRITAQGTQVGSEVNPVNQFSETSIFAIKQP